MEGRKPIWIFASVFVLMIVLTQLLAYQQYLIIKEVQLERISREANMVRDRLKTSLTHSLSATKTLAFLVARYGVPEDFDSVAAGILASNEFIDAIELTRRGVITHIYPSEGNVDVIGYDVLADSLRNTEAFKAISRKSLVFAGPFELRQGGMAVVGRLPIFRDNTFWGFSAVLIRLSTLLEAAGINLDSNNVFRYQLSKRNPITGEEEFFLPGPAPASQSYVSIEVPDGEWNLYVLPRHTTGFVSRVLPFSLLGLIWSATASLFAWHLAHQPEKLKRTVRQIEEAMDASQKKSTESLQRANRLYHFTSTINHLMVHVTNEEKLYAEVCKIAVAIGQFKMAWIGMIDHESQRLVPVASAGDESGYLAEIAPIPLTPEAIEGPALRMMRTGTFVSCNMIATDPLMAPWAHHAVSRGYHSSILLPIRKYGQIIGSFNLYAPQPDSFDDKETQLLLETTSNISFTLENFDKEKKRQYAEWQITVEKMLSDSIINSLPGVFYLYDRTGKFMRWNKNLENILGYTADEVVTMHPLDFFHGEEKLLLRKKIEDVFVSGYADVMAHFFTKDGRCIPYYFNGMRINFEGVDYLIGMGLDITDRIRTESELRERTEEIRKLSSHLEHIQEEERSRIALEIHDVLGQQLTALKMDSVWLKKKVDDRAVSERVTGMIALIDDTIKTVRRISSELRPGILDDLGLVAALEWQGTEFQKNTGIAFRFETNQSDIVLDRNIATHIFRVFQEALTNIARHANATEVNASFVQHDGTIQLVVKDNGVGIDLGEVKSKGSLGLIGMKERARLLRGDVTITNVVPHGTAMTMEIPIVNQNEKI